MSKYFPVHESHQQAAQSGCFNCGDHLNAESATESGYSSGAYSAPCGKCGMRTFYDIAQKKAA